MAGSARRDRSVFGLITTNAKDGGVISIRGSRFSPVSVGTLVTSRV